MYTTSGFSFFSLRTVKDYNMSAAVIFRIQKSLVKTKFIITFSSLKTSVPASVLINCVAIGNFDLDHPVEQVAFGCEGGKVLLYRLDELSKLNQPPFRTVNVKEEIKDLTPVQVMIRK